MHHQSSKSLRIVACLRAVILYFCPILDGWKSPSLGHSSQIFPPIQYGDQKKHYHLQAGYRNRRRFFHWSQYTIPEVYEPWISIQQKAIPESSFSFSNRTTLYRGTCSHINNHKIIQNDGEMIKLKNTHQTFIYDIKFCSAKKKGIACT